MKLRIIPFAAVPLMLVGYSGVRSPEVTVSLQQIQPLLAQPKVLTALQPITYQTAASPTTNTAKRVYLAERQVSFVPPAGFTALTPEEIALKFPPTGHQPQYVYANERRSVLS